MDAALPPLTRRAALVGAAGLVLAGCAGDPGPGGAADPTGAGGRDEPPTPSPAGSVETPVTTVASAHGLAAMWPHEPLEITIEHGSVHQVTVADEAGQPVPGSVRDSHWRPERGALLVRANYLVEVTAEDAAGQLHTTTVPVSTVDPELVAEIDFRYAGEAVGAGMPIWVRFDMPVPVEHRAAIERTATVTTVPEQEGAWGWVDDTTLYWRPREYWLPGSSAHVEVLAGGLPAGDTWVLADASADYQYGDRRVLRVDIDAHTLTCWRNDERVLMLPVSMGKPGWETMTGTKVIMEKQEQVVMDSESFGVPHSDPEGYRIIANKAQRLTWSGEYFHAAPWADWAHGSANVSHGCTGLSNENAAWLYDFTAVGDPAEFTGHTHAVQPHQTIGCWAYSWPDWQAQSAL